MAARTFDGEHNNIWREAAEATGLDPHQIIANSMVLSNDFGIWKLTWEGVKTLTDEQAGMVLSILYGHPVRIEREDDLP